MKDFDSSKDMPLRKWKATEWKNICKLYMWWRILAKIHKEPSQLKNIKTKRFKYRIHQSRYTNS